MSELQPQSNVQTEPEENRIMLLHRTKDLAQRLHVPFECSRGNIKALVGDNCLRDCLSLQASGGSNACGELSTQTTHGPRPRFCPVYAHVRLHLSPSLALERGSGVSIYLGHLGSQPWFAVAVWFSLRKHSTDTAESISAMPLGRSLVVELLHQPREKPDGTKKPYDACCCLHPDAHAHHRVRGSATCKKSGRFRPQGVVTSECGGTVRVGR